jgi:DNA helicase IV
VTQPLTDEARLVIAEEEALLQRVLDTLRTASHRSASVRGSRALLSDLKELRDEASTASERDLPSLFQQMTTVRALAERDDRRPIPSFDTPYFAHLRVRTKQGPRDYLLGRASYAETAANVRIVDWRFAPVARIFYGYQQGDEYAEMLPGGLSEGVVEARRVVVIERGVLTRIVAGRLMLARQKDGTWAEEGSAASMVSGGTGTATRPGMLGIGHGASGKAGKADITALLDNEQFEALTQSPDRALLVIGSAGSGKTTVALHRLAKLAFDDPQRFPAAKMRVIVPEEGLARLSKRLLAPLGLSDIRVDTLDSWVYRTATQAFGMQKIKVCKEPPALVARLKRHPALHDLLVKRASRREDGQANFKTLKRRLAELFTDRAFLGAVVDAAQGDLPRTAIDATVRHTMLQIATPFASEYAVTDPERLKTVDGGSLEEGTPEELAGSVDLEDLALFLFLRARGGGFRGGDLAHVVLDETEDFSLYELTILGELLGRKKSATLAGDEMQQTLSSFAGWPKMLETLGAPNAGICRLQVSYRCPKPVVEIAQHVLGVADTSSMAKPGREGVPVGYHHFPDEAQSHLFLANALRDLVDREPFASIGVISSEPETAERLYGALESLSQARLVLNGEFTFEPGIDVTDIDHVKGLEFDYVILSDVTAESYPVTDESRRRLHVGVTRTSHQLWVVSSGVRSPILRGL